MRTNFQRPHHPSIAPSCPSRPSHPLELPDFSGISGAFSNENRSPGVARPPHPHAAFATPYPSRNPPQILPDANFRPVEIIVLTQRDPAKLTHFRLTVFRRE